MSEQPNKKKWKSRKESYTDALNYIDGRRKGNITSLKTPWEKFNDAGIDGIEWQSLVLIGARPAGGKTCLKDQLINQAFNLNPKSIFRVLDFRFEMINRVTAIREFSGAVGKPYKDLCSASTPVEKEVLDNCLTYAIEKSNENKYPVDVVDEPCTVSEFVEMVHDYMHQYMQADGDYTNTIIAIDHTLLFLHGPGENTDQQMLANLGKSLTALKKRYPIIFIVLSQLNRNIENADRNEDGKRGNYILTSDIFGSDCLLHHADLVIGINRPALQDIKFYGPHQYIIEDDNVLVMHFLKCRNGDIRMSFFKAEFEKMRITEIVTPPCAQKRGKN